MGWPQTVMIIMAVLDLLWAGINPEFTADKRFGSIFGTILVQWLLWMGGFYSH